MELSGSEMVLGMDWLASLGNIEANFGNLCLKWEVQGNKHIIQGDSSMCNSQVNWRTMLKAICKEGMGFYVQEVEGELKDKINHGITSDWEEVVTRFEDVFDMPMGLPPHREHDHAIILQPDAIILNLRPYRYPFYQKNEIEKMVKEMMHAGIIRHSTSPFSSPILLVKKKDGAWEGLEEEIQGDEKLKNLIQDLVSNSTSHPGYQLRGGKLFHEGRIVIPKQSPRIAWILHEFHDTATGGHSGYLRTYKKIAGLVYWEGMRKCIKSYVESCEVCQRNKYQTWSPEFWYNTNYHASLKSTPFEALYGRRPPVLVRGDVHLSAVEEVNKLTAERKEMIRKMKEQLLKAQDQMRVQANKHRREVDYQVGDKVYLKIKPYKLQKLAKRFNQKLSPRYYGPYEIIESVGVVAYKLKLPEDSRVHPVFHASLLKKTVLANVETQPLPTCMNESWQLEPGPEEARDTRVNEKGELEVLVKREGLPEFENSWELVEKMRQEFPGFLFEVKESLEGGGIDRYDIVYTRKCRNKGREAQDQVNATNSLQLIR
ncbi:hypothetical protein KIW84_055987 [Lathyrus oleraceus]|uniref:Uncharacterized protein n=1 Tax=Pisum sativum TaxID=3888 RepID=A0A9D5AM02_PEA|nr:hypothetical protein KIW84_055987 [Pisum sativum]